MKRIIVGVAALIAGLLFYCPESEAAGYSEVGQYGRPGIMKYDDTEEQITEEIRLGEMELIAQLVQAEAGNQPYEGQVAVGSVIMNRLNRGYGSSVHSVIFARGQFYPATSAKIARIISNGPKASCMQAAADALNGADMVNGCTSYRPVRSGRSGIVIGGHVFF